MYKGRFRRSGGSGRKIDKMIDISLYNKLLTITDIDAGTCRSTDAATLKVVDGIVGSVGIAVDAADGCIRRCAVAPDGDTALGEGRERGNLVISGLHRLLYHHTFIFHLVDGEGDVAGALSNCPGACLVARDGTVGIQLHGNGFGSLLLGVVELVRMNQQLEVPGYRSE